MYDDADFDDVVSYLTSGMSGVLDLPVVEVVLVVVEVIGNGQNGFLAGWVASKAQLGEVADAWRRMLENFNRSPDFGKEELPT